MSKFYLFRDGPDLYKDPSKYYIQGCSPTILKEFIKYLDSNENRLAEINASLYLYNNPILHGYFKKISSKGVKVNIVSIPLEGYDADSPQRIVELKTNKQCYNSLKTKFHIAEKIYIDSKENAFSNFGLYVFPHMYIRSERVKPFSRGNMPYSLHIKSFYIKFKDGTGAIALTSSNLAVRDKIKDELMIIVEGDTNSNETAQHYFSALMDNSIHIDSFVFSKNWCDYPIKKKDQVQITNSNFYTAPFYNNSQDYSETVLINLIKNAKKRIYVCAQHICAYNYSYNKAYKSSNNVELGYEKREGILSEIIKKSKENISIKLLSQTFVDENEESHGCRRPQNVKAFANFIKNYDITSNHSYGVNASVHNKFIVVDDIAVVTSCNFTPTQFIYLDNVVINKFDNIPKLKYSGIHSEVGQYIVLENKDLCDRLIEIFESIWSRESTFHYSKQTKTTDKDIKQLKCSKCGSEMKLRTGPYGQFYGCSNFPNCKNTQKI